GFTYLSNIIRGCSKSPVKLTLRISSLACFSVPHVLITYVLVLKATLPRTSRSILSSFLKRIISYKRIGDYYGTNKNTLADITDGIIHVTSRFFISINRRS